MESNNIHFEKIPCICCGYIIEEDMLFAVERNGVNKIWNSGGVVELSLGYGSILDGDVFHIGLCDTCIDIKASEGLIYYKYNYINNLPNSKTESWNNGKISKLREIEIDKIIEDIK